MDSLIATFLTVLLAETGDQLQLLAAALALRFKNDTKVIIALLWVSAITCAFSAYMGSAIKQWISNDPLLLFNGIAYLFAGTAMLFPLRAVNLLEKWKTGPFMTAFFGLGIMGFGDKSQFVIAANAANYQFWPWVALGGWLGIIVAIVPAIILKEKLAALLPLKSIRRGGGAILLTLGLVQVLRAWRII